MSIAEQVLGPSLDSKNNYKNEGQIKQTQLLLDVGKFWRVNPKCYGVSPLILS